MSSPESGVPVELRQGLNQLALLLSLERNRLSPAEFQRLLRLMVEVRLAGEQLRQGEGLVAWNERVLRDSSRLMGGLEEGDHSEGMAGGLEAMLRALGTLASQAPAPGLQQGRGRPRGAALLAGVPLGHGLQAG